MKRLITLSGILMLPIFLFAQSSPEIGMFIGISTYSGDLTEGSLTYRQSHPSTGVLFRMPVYKNFGIRAGIDWGRLSGSDKLNADSSLFPRNLSFITNLADMHLLAEYNFFNYGDNGFTPYFFAGISVFHFNPFVFDSTGKKVFLRPLSTEGEGLPEYPDRKPYNLTQISIPFGVGIKYALTSTINLAFEFRINKTFTDYIDDVSTAYVDRNILLRERGSAAVYYAYRTNELPAYRNDPYPAAGAQRGNPRIKDWYYFTGFTITYNLNEPHKSFWGAKINPLRNPGAK